MYFEVVNIFQMVYLSVLIKKKKVSLQGHDTSCQGQRWDEEIATSWLKKSDMVTKNIPLTLLESSLHLDQSQIRKTWDGIFEVMKKIFSFSINQRLHSMRGLQALKFKLLGCPFKNPISHTVMIVLNRIFILYVSDLLN